MIILKFFWWAVFIGSAIASIGSFTNEKANSMGRLKKLCWDIFLNDIRNYLFCRNIF